MSDHPASGPPANPFLDAVQATPAGTGPAPRAVVAASADLAAVTDPFGIGDAAAPAAARPAPRKAAVASVPDPAPKAPAVKKASAAKKTAKRAPATKKTTASRPKKTTARKPASSLPPRPKKAAGAECLPDDVVLTLVAEAEEALGDGSHVEELPVKLSPSRGKDYQQCPRLFYYKTILHLRTPPTVATTRGTLTHTALERIFDYPAETRTPEVAVPYVRAAWANLIDPLRARADVEPGSPEDVIRGLEENYRDMVLPGSEEEQKKLAAAQQYQDLVAGDPTKEEELLTSAEEMVRRWFQMERVANFDPTKVVLPDGSKLDGRELYLDAEVIGAPLHGIIDRLDSWATAEGKRLYSISDYKTGKVVGEGRRYSQQWMNKIREDAFFAMKVYAVLCEEMFGIVPQMLRLIYVKTGSREEGILTYRVTPQMMARTRAEMSRLWKDIVKTAEQKKWEPKTGPLCSWCAFRAACPAFSDASSGEDAPEAPALPRAS